MGLPSINITFVTAAQATVRRSLKGVVALIVRDTLAVGVHVLTSAVEIPATLGADNRDYIARTFLGYVNPPRRVIVYVLSAEEELTEALDYFATQTFDYLVGPPDITGAECTAVASWIRARRLNDRAICKAVLPETAADSEAIVNFTTGDIAVGDVVYTAAEYCSRMAGLIAGTPWTIACTYAPLAEVNNVARMSESEMNTAIDAGQLILVHDGVKVKVADGVTSFTSVTAEKGDLYRKIKLVEAVDTINTDLRRTAEDSYIGRMVNSYDNKMLLISAIMGYFETLEREGILAPGASSCEIDATANEAYLKGRGVDTSEMEEQEIREANTGDAVFLTARITIQDVVETITLRVNV